VFGVNDLTYEEALTFIDQCEERGVPILGFEWFLREGDAVTPAGIADFSTAPKQTTWDEARNLLRDGIPDGGNTVEFTTG
jgi:hypothetical protein